MMTSWNKTKQIDDYIFGTADGGSALLFEAQMILDTELHDKIKWQKKTYSIIHQYGRRQLKQEIEAIHQQLFTRPEHLNFSQKVRLLFTNRK